VQAARACSCHHRSLSSHVYLYRTCNTACGLDHTRSHSWLCDTARQNRQLSLKSGMHPLARMNWPPFCSRTNWSLSLFRTVVQLCKPTYQSKVTRAYCYHLSPLATISQHRTFSHSQVYPSKSRHQDSDGDVDLQVLSQFERMEGGGTVKRRHNPWKLKQLRFTRHIVNLIRKGKVRSSFLPIMIGRGYWSGRKYVLLSIDNGYTCTFWHWPWP